MDLGLKRQATTPIETMECIVVVTMLEVYKGIKRLATTIYIIVDQELMLTGEVYKVIRTATIIPITHVAILYCWVYQFLIILLSKMFINIRY